MQKCDPLQHPSAQIRHTEIIRLGMASAGFFLMYWMLPDGAHPQ